MIEYDDLNGAFDFRKFTDCCSIKKTGKRGSLKAIVEWEKCLNFQSIHACVKKTRIRKIILQRIELKIKKTYVKMRKPNFAARVRGSTIKSKGLGSGQTYVRKSAPQKLLISRLWIIYFDRLRLARYVEQTKASLNFPDDERLCIGNIGTYISQYTR